MSTVTTVATRVGGEALEQEFESIFRQHGHFVYRTAYSVTGSRQDAEDIAQTIFMKLLERNLPSALIRNPKAYLYRAAINASLNTIRSRKHQDPGSAVDFRNTPAAEATSTTDTLMQRRLLEAIARLKPQAVEILILHYEHGHSDAEIAQILGKSRGAVAVTLNRTRALLKKLLTASHGKK